MDFLTNPILALFGFAPKGILPGDKEGEDDCWGAHGYPGFSALKPGADSWESGSSGSPLLSLGPLAAFSGKANSSPAGAASPNLMTSSPSDPCPLGLSSGTALSTNGKSRTEAGGDCSIRAGTHGLLCRKHGRTRMILRSQGRLPRIALWWDHPH